MTLDDLIYRCLYNSAAEASSGEQKLIVNKWVTLPINHSSVRPLEGFRIVPAQREYCYQWRWSGKGNVETRDYTVDEWVELMKIERK